MNDRDRLVWMYEQMLRIREFEERVKRTFEEHPGVIRGHTHLADRPFRPAGDGPPLVASSGAWQRTIYPVQIEQLARERALAIPELLSTLRPESLAPCYTFLRIGPAGWRAPEPRAWRGGPQNEWRMAGSCSGQP